MKREKKFWEINIKKNARKYFSETFKTFQAFFYDKNLFLSIFIFETVYNFLNLSLLRLFDMKTWHINKIFKQKYNFPSILSASRIVKTCDNINLVIEFIFRNGE